MNSVSIILCFYKGENKLPKTIEHLKNLNLEGIDNVELLLIDNNSPDNSRKIIETELKDFTKFSWRLINETKPGQTFARICGIKESKYDCILFCDEDNWISQDYLKKGLTILNENNKIGVLGGLGIVVSDIEIPEWFEKHQSCFAVGPQMPITGEVKGTRNIVYGAGMLVRKEALDTLFNKGFYFYTTGRLPSKLASGDDSELCLGIKVAGYKIWYDQSLTFQHDISSDRLTLDYVRKVQEGDASSNYVIRFYREFINGYVPKVNNWFWVKEFLYSIKDLFLVIFKYRDKQSIKRNFHFSKYLIQRNSKYNDDVANIVKICQSLSPIK